MQGTRGLSLLELLIALGLLGLVIVLLPRLPGPSTARQAAHSAKAMALWCHLQALSGGSAVALVQNAGGLVARSGTGQDACTTGDPVRTMAWRTFPRTRVLDSFRAGILWRADGIALSCAGGGVISDRMVLSDGRSRYAVVVSSLGRVRVERLP